jgi:hypothetical protein
LLQGHARTDYRRWFAAKEAYSIKFAEGYEPWFIVDRFQNPFYDEIFRGYGWNKVSHVVNINNQGYEFLVHPSGFLIHRQHAKSNADKLYKEQTAKWRADKDKGQATDDQPGDNIASVTQYFKKKVLTGMKNGTYTPLIAPNIQRCAKTLTWWNAAAAGVPKAPGATYRPGIVWNPSHRRLLHRQMPAAS